MTKLYDDLRRMRYIMRFNGKPLLKPENDAEHNHGVSQTCLRIGIDNKQSLDLETLLAKAIMHDTEESITGDIGHDFKHRSEDFYARIEKEGEEMFKEKWGNTNLALYKYLQMGKTTEDRVVKFADYVEAFFNTVEDFHLGNRHPIVTKSIVRQYETILTEFRDAIFRPYIKELRAIFDGVKG